MKEGKVLRVKSNTEPAKLAGSIAKELRENKVVVLHGIGAGPINQSVKAWITARTFLIADGIDIKVTPAFEHIETEKGIITTIILTMESVKEIEANYE